MNAVNYPPFEQWRIHHYIFTFGCKNDSKNVNMLKTKSGLIFTHIKIKEVIRQAICIFQFFYALLM